MLQLLDNSWPEARQPGCKRTMNGDHGTLSRDGPLRTLGRVYRGPGGYNFYISDALSLPS